MTDLAVPGPSDENLWLLCLAAADLGRRGQVAADAPSGWRYARRALRPVRAGEAVELRWRPALGWQLAGRRTARERELFALYEPVLRAQVRGLPWRLAHLGQSLDGCIATHTGDSCYVNGDANLVHLHRLRALCDAVVVGAGTVASDDPQLTTRRVAGPHPARVVLDPSATLPARHGVFRDGQAPTWLLCDAQHAAQARRRHGRDRVVAVPGLRHAQHGLDAQAATQAMQALGLRVLFIEGGGVTVSRFLAQGALERLQVAVAPVVIGANGRAGLQLPGTAALRDCLRPPCRIVRMGPDVLWDLDLVARD